jgi:TIGR03009 family protein
MSDSCRAILVSTLFLAGTMVAGIGTAQQADPAGEIRASTQYAAPQDPTVPGTGPESGLEQYEHMLMREPVQPDFLPLAPDHEAYLIKLLDHWEKTSSSIKRLTCEFQRWDYNTSICDWRNPADNRLAAARIVRGRIQYGEPDKADSKSTETWEFAGTKDNAGTEPAYQQISDETANERWMCDGKAIYEFDYTNKRLYEVSIPPEMQGAALSQSPLPFLFGAKRADLMDRFWLRVATPQGVENEYWLEAWPKRRDDATNYQRVEIIIAAEDFLPKSIHIYSRDYDAATNPSSHHFEFSNRQVNNQLDGIKDFFGVFIRPSTQIGWERVLLDKAQAGEATATAPTGTDNRGAQAVDPNAGVDR